MLISKIYGTNKQTCLKSQAKQTYPQDRFNRNICFSGFNNITSLGQKTIKGQELNLTKLLADHETYFYRNPEIIGYAAKHLRTKYPKGTLIVNPFSSIGEEARTLSILLPSKKYQIIGIDLMEDVVEKTQKGKHVISSKPYQYRYNASSDDISIYPEDAFLLKPDEELTPKQAEFKKRFFKRFEIKSTSQDEITVQAREQTFPNISFTQGNVMNIAQIIDDTSQKEKVGAFIAQNGFYHILGNNKDVTNGNLALTSRSNCHLDQFAQAISDMHSKADKDAILVYGNLDRDHLNQEDLNLFEDRNFLQELSKNQNHYQDSAIHRIIIERGFEPIYYAPCNTPAANLKSKQIMVPAVFKKSN